MLFPFGDLSLSCPDHLLLAAIRCVSYAGVVTSLTSVSRYAFTQKTAWKNWIGHIICMSRVWLMRKRNDKEPIADKIWPRADPFKSQSIFFPCYFVSFHGEEQSLKGKWVHWLVTKRGYTILSSGASAVATYYKLLPNDQGAKFAKSIIEYWRG